MLWPLSPEDIERSFIPWRVEVNVANLLSSHLYFRVITNLFPEHDFNLISVAFIEDLSLRWRGIRENFFWLEPLCERGLLLKEILLMGGVLSHFLIELLFSFLEFEVFFLREFEEWLRQTDLRANA